MDIDKDLRRPEYLGKGGEIMDERGIRCRRRARLCRDEMGGALIRARPPQKGCGASEDDFVLLASERLTENGSVSRGTPRVAPMIHA